MDTDTVVSTGGHDPMRSSEDPSLVAAARAGDEAAFSALVDRHQHELRVHCYRMMGSFTDAEDLVQETLLRAWSRRDTFEGRSTYRAWLYRIATNACLDALRRLPRSRQFASAPAAGPSEVPWLQPFPDSLLDAASSEEEPDAVVVARETIELAYLAAIQHIPPTRRAVLILRDVVGLRAAETADLLGIGVEAANSHLRRARATMREQLPSSRVEWPSSTQITAEEHATLRRYVAASERADMAAFTELLAAEVVQTMPPQPTVFAGREAVVAAWASIAIGPDRWGAWAVLPAAANRQPATANYLRRHDDPVYRAFNLDVLTIRGGLVTAVTSFGPEMFPAFELPATLSRP